MIKSLVGQQSIFAAPAPSSCSATKKGKIRHLAMESAMQF